MGNIHNGEKGFNVELAIMNQTSVKVKNGLALSGGSPVGNVRKALGAEDVFEGSAAGQDSLSFVAGWILPTVEGRSPQAVSPACRNGAGACNCLMVRA